MKILQFKLGGEYEYNVVFETITDKRKLQTNDQPTGSLNAAITAAADSAVSFYKISGITHLFNKITFSYPINDRECFVFELAIKSKENPYITHSLKTEKIYLNEDEVLAGKNDLIEKVIKCREEIESYVSGARNQQELSFEEKVKNEDEGDLFND
jgi:hypothetical protein